MPRSVWIPVTFLGMGVAGMVVLSVHRRSSLEACPTCAAATVSDRELTPTKPLAPSQALSSFGPGPAAEEDDDDASDFVGLGIQLVRARHLTKLPAREEPATAEELQARIGQQLKDSFPEGHGLKEGRALAALGAIPAPVDTLAQRASWWAQYFGVWYSSETDTLLRARDEWGRATVQDSALGEAFAMLMREHGDWLKKDATTPSMDAWLARESLLAGDAAFTGSLQARKTLVAWGQSAAPAPRDFLQDLEWASLGAGENFAKALHHLGEFDQVNAAYERPPVVTAELLDAGLYFSEEQFVPKTPAWTDVQVSGQPPFWDDSLGQLGTNVFLWQGLPQKVAEEASNGWSGDRWLAYDAGDAARGHVVWQTFWKDPEAADRFYATLQQFLKTKHPDAPGTDSPEPWKWTAGGRSIILVRTDGGRAVFYADAATPEFAEALWKKFVKP